MQVSASRSSLGGTAVLMSCACGLSSNTVLALGLIGVAATTQMVHSVFIGVSAALILYGLWRTSRQSAYIGMAAFVVLAVAAALTPPRVMATSALPWNTAHMAGAGLYLVAAALLGYAFWRAFPTRKPAASATAIGGAALATGCTCCMVTGAMAGMGVTAGASMQLEQVPVLFWTGLAVIAVGLFRLGGVRAALWVPVGGLIVRYGPLLFGSVKTSGVNPLAFPKYFVTLAGTGAIMYGFAVAYRAVRTARTAPAWVPALDPLG